MSFPKIVKQDPRRNESAQGQNPNPDQSQGKRGGRKRKDDQERTALQQVAREARIRRREMRWSWRSAACEEDKKRSLSMALARSGGRQYAWMTKVDEGTRQGATANHSRIQPNSLSQQLPTPLINTFQGSVQGNVRKATGVQDQEFRDTQYVINLTREAHEIEPNQELAETGSRQVLDSQLDAEFDGIPLQGVLHN